MTPRGYVFQLPFWEPCLSCVCVNNKYSVFCKSGWRNLGSVIYILSHPFHNHHHHHISIRSGHLLNSILLTFQNQGSVSKSAFSTNAQSRFASVVVDGVLGPLRLARHTDGVLVLLYFCEHRTRRVLK